MNHLMIKRHRVTGLRYLCKTSCQDPYRYLGSGKRWKRHLRVHGRDVETRVIFSCDDVEIFSRVARFISGELDVVSDPGWANLMEENGLDGGVTHRDPAWLRGFRHSNMTKEMISRASAETIARRKARGDDLSTFGGRTHTPEARAKISGQRKGVKFSVEHRRNISLGQRGTRKTLTREQRLDRSKNMREMLLKKVACERCGSVGNAGQIARWHRDCGG